MLAPDYLALRLVHLKEPQSLTVTKDGLWFILVREGMGGFATGLGSQPLAPGDVLVAPGIQGGELCAAQGHEFLFWTFTLSLENIFPLLAIHEIPLLENIERAFIGLRFYPAQSIMAQECRRLLSKAPPHINLEHRIQLLRIVAAVLGQEIDSAQAQRVGFAHVEERMAQVFHKLSAQDILTMNVGELSAEFGCSRRHLNRLFQQHFGFSVAALKMDMRLLRAVSLLRNPKTKIINVAEQCGFNQLSLFNTCFKRRFGTSPSQWRKWCQGDGSGLAEVNRGDNHCQMRENGLCPWTGQPPHPVHSDFRVTSGHRLLAPDQDFQTLHCPLTGVGGKGPIGVAR
jgi:AraC-like DNA-binding protein